MLIVTAPVSNIKFEEWYESIPARPPMGTLRHDHPSKEIHVQWNAAENRYTVMSLKQQQWLAWKAGYAAGLAEK